MSDYTPTTERVRDTWTNAMLEGCASDEELADARWETELRDAQFDRWLAAHDAEVRAGAVAEEPEWEHGLEMPLHTGTTIVAAGDEITAKSQAWLYPMYRRRKAGAWEPVEQEGADQ